MTEELLTEAYMVDTLVKSAKLAGEIMARAIVVNRTVNNPSRTLKRTVRIALIVQSNKEILIDALIKTCLDEDNLFYFVGSDVNLQSDMEVDYLFFEADIMGKL